jgi:hypothetical protein
MTTTCFDKFRSHSDKFESLYMIIVNNMDTTELTEKVNHQLKLINTLNDNVKRKFLNDRLFGFKSYLSMQKYNKENEKISKVFFIYGDVEEIDLRKEWIQVLLDFQVDNYILKYGDTFQIDYLIELFTDVSFKTVIAVRNNILQHIHLNSTKKKIISTIESKSLDIEQYVTENIKEFCLIHGVSVSLKGLKLDNHKIIHKHLRDEEILDEFTNILNKNILEELSEILGYIQNPKMMHRVIFGKDIGKGIKNMTIKIIYCTKEMYHKIHNQVDKSFLNFEIKIVKMCENGDAADIVKNQYNGAIGFTYY